MPIMRFWEKIKNIFNSGQSECKNSDEVTENLSTEEEILSHELIERTDLDKAYYAQWSASTAKTNILNWLLQEYQNYREKACCDRALMFLMIPSVNGFIINFDEGRWHEQDFISLFDYFKDQIKNGDEYFVQVSDIKTVARGNSIESVQRHYLKPPRAFNLEFGQKRNQKFGNMMLSLTSKNGIIQSLKLSATHYNDHQFEKAYSFDDLMNLLCQA
jgi:hypothetical protein